MSARDSSNRVGWVVATEDHEGILHLDWDGELHPRKHDAVRELRECEAAGWKCRLLKVEKDA